MLRYLRINNFAIIDEIEVEFREGFNVLTGETGAGKSILIGALGLILGARISQDFIRSGADEARVEALFEIDDASVFPEDLKPDFKDSEELGDFPTDPAKWKIEMRHKRENDSPFNS